MIIAVDASGGEHAPHEIVKGALKAAHEYKVGIALIGKKEILHVLASRHAKNLNISIIDAPEVIEDTESPIEAVTKKSNSSIVTGIKMVKEGSAQAFVSAGSTGAVMYAAFAGLGPVNGLDRPAIASIITLNIANPFLMLDCGANSNCRPKHLLQFAQLGNIFVHQVFRVASPRIGLLNNGEEEKKGNQLTRETYQILKASDLNFVGNIEGQNLGKGMADVIVTDGFTGNIVMKTLEGVGEEFINLRNVSQMFSSNSSSETRATLADAGLNSMIRRFDYRESGGALLLGLNGIVVKSHGRSQARAIKNAIGLAKQSIDRNVCQMIQQYNFADTSALVNGTKE
ncbi:MAG: phosphate acyltransferase PlsX [Dehalococcoidales bacterium]|nr:phosphate acyltransferase PlsX [Dehalococcoidales bacterium]